MSDFSEVCLVVKTWKDRTWLLVAAPLNAPLTWMEQADGLGANPSHPINVELLSTVTETSLVCSSYTLALSNLQRDTEKYSPAGTKPLPLKYCSIQKVLLFLFHVLTLSGRFISFMLMPHYLICSCLSLLYPFLSSLSSSYLQRWCMLWSLVMWQPLSRGCTRAGPSTTPEPKTSRTSYVSIICHRASSSECWSIFRQLGRSTTASTAMRYKMRTHLHILYTKACINPFLFNLYFISPNSTTYKDQYLISKIT